MTSQKRDFAREDTGLSYWGCNVRRITTIVCRYITGNEVPSARLLQRIQYGIRYFLRGGEKILTIVRARMYGMYIKDLKTAYNLIFPSLYFLFGGLRI